MATEKLKINYKHQNKTWTNPHINNLKNRHELKAEQTTDATKKIIKHVLEILNIINFIGGENYESSLVQVSWQTMKYEGII